MAKFDVPFRHIYYPFTNSPNAMLDEGYRERNREAWNEAAEVHRKGRDVDYSEAFKDPEYSVLDSTLTALLDGLSLTGARIAQLGCNDGRELFSIVNRFGGSGVGFDISDDFIAEAERTQGSTGLDCSFVRTDVLTIQPGDNGPFDMVLFTAGALAWYHDLEPLFTIAAGLLGPGGHIVIYEIHPATNMLGCKEEKEYDPDHPALPVHSYFRNEPWVENDGADYIGGTIYESKTFTSFSHQVSDLVNAVVRSGLEITEFREYPHDVTPHFGEVEKDGGFPLSYSLVAMKS